MRVTEELYSAGRHGHRSRMANIFEGLVTVFPQEAFGGTEAMRFGHRTRGV